MGSVFYDTKWAAISDAKYTSYSLSRVKNNVSGAANGASGWYYNVVFVDNDIKELRSKSVAGIYDLQDLGIFYASNLPVFTGCVTTRLS